MSPTSLRGELRRVVLRGVANLVAIEYAKTDSVDEPDTSPEIAEARDRINRRWSEEERLTRWLMAHSIGSIVAADPDYNRKAVQRCRHRKRLADAMKGGAT